MDQARANYLTACLNRKGVTSPCPRCGHPHFSVLGEANLDIDTARGLLGFSRTSMPTVVVGCNHCGFLTTHAVAALEYEPQVGLFGTQLGGANYGE